MIDDPVPERSTYSRVAIWLHWIIALLVIANVALVFAHEAVEGPFSRTLMNWHKANGITVLALTLVRLGWRLAHRPPPYPQGVAGWERAASKLVHWSFYVLLVALPLSGWLWMSAAEVARPISWFGLFTVPFLPVGRGEDASDAFHEAHEFMGLLTIGLVLLHVGAALKHQFLDRNNLLSRMIPALRVR